MLSWTIFRRAIMLVVDDVGAALRITALPYAIFAGVSLWLAGTLDIATLARLEADAAAGAAGGTASPGVLGSVLLAALVQLVAFLWIAVAWHRYVLLREGGEGWVAPLEGRLLAGYLGRSLLIGLIALAVVIMVTVAVAPFAPALAATLSLILGLAITYRLGLILPAGAIGRPLDVAEAWRATQGQTGTVVILALLTLALSLLFQVPALLDARGAVETAGAVDAGTAAAGRGPVALVYELVVTWILLMLSVSVLSTLYGHLVEGRRLD